MNFAAVYYRFYSMGYSLHNTKQEAIDALEAGSEHGYIMDVLVCELSSKEMVWFKEFVGEENCKKDLAKFLRLYEKEIER